MAIKNGDKVKVDYTGKLDDGTVFDTTEGRQPLEFEVGSGKVIPGFENGIIGMELGEKKTIKIEAKDAYGDHKENLVAEIDKKHLPKDMEPKVGLQLEIKQENGQNIFAVIKKVSDDTITIDANHPLAGKDLTFEVELVEIN